MCAPQSSQVRALLREFKNAALQVNCGSVWNIPHSAIGYVIPSLISTTEWRRPHSLNERAPEMAKEKRDFPESPAENSPDEAGSVEVKFGGTTASILEHLPFTFSRKIRGHDATVGR